MRNRDLSSATDDEPWKGVQKRGKILHVLLTACFQMHFEFRKKFELTPRG